MIEEDKQLGVWDGGESEAKGVNPKKRKKDAMAMKPKKRKLDNPGDDAETKRFCARCKNHGVDARLKGHKDFCPWRDCKCHLCWDTKMRQSLMAKQTAERRKRNQMNDRISQGLPTFVPTIRDIMRYEVTRCIITEQQVLNYKTPTPAPGVIAEAAVSEDTTPKVVTPTEPTEQTPEPKEDTNPNDKDPKDLKRVKKRMKSSEVNWDDIIELMNYFKFNVNASPLLYLILKYMTRNDILSACNIIFSAMEDIKTISSNRVFKDPSKTDIVLSSLMFPPQKVLDLSHQQGTEDPRTPMLTYPFPKPAGAPLPPSPSYYQSDRQPHWPHPTQPQEQDSYPQVPKDDEEDRTQVESDNSDDEDEVDVGVDEYTEPIDILDLSGEKITKKTNEQGPIENRENNILEEDKEKKNSTVPGLYRPFTEGPDSGQIQDSTQPKDEFSVYGEHVGNQLRNLSDRHSLTVARYEIDQIIFSASVGEFSVRSCQCCQVSPKEQLYTPGTSPQPSTPSPVLQPYQPTSQPRAPVHPQPIRPTIVNLELDMCQIIRRC